MKIVEKIVKIGVDMCMDCVLVWGVMQNTTSVGQTWKLRSGLLYAGIDSELQAILCGPDDPRIQVFDQRDSKEVKAKFYGLLLGCRFEAEIQR